MVNYTCNQGWVGDGSMECKVRLPPRPHALPTLVVVVVVVVMMHVVVAPCTRHEAFRAFRTMCLKCTCTSITLYTCLNGWLYEASDLKPTHEWCF